MRPEYKNNDTLPSLTTWEEACVISQDWADGARLAAAKRRNRRSIILAALVAALLIIAVLLFLFLFAGFEV